MERNRDLRKSSLSSVNGLPRRLQRSTTPRDSIDQDRQMDLQETVRLGDPRQLHKNDREREFPKRRRVIRSTLQQRSDDVENRENEGKDSSDEEYYEDEEETRIHQQNRMNQVSPTSSFLSNNRRGLRTLRSSPALRASADEMFGVPIPRRARSAKKLHEYCNSGSGSFGENLSHRRFSPSPAAVSLIGTSGASPSYSGASMKKKMKSVDRNIPVFRVASNPNLSVIQDDIEIEVAEALFDLMKQSQSRSLSLQMQEKVDRDSTNNASDELKISKADGGKDENSAFSVQNEPVKLIAETIMADSVKEFRKEERIERGKYPDDTALDLNGDLVNGDGIVNKVIVGSPKESESPSQFIKVNACDIQDPTVTNAHNEAIIAEAKKEAKMEIDLMVLPLVPPSPDRGALVDTGTDDPKVVITRDFQKKSEAISKDGTLAVAIGMQEEKIGMEKCRRDDCRHDDISSASGSSTQQQQGHKEQKNHSSTSFSPFSFGMSSWSGVLPRPGCIPPIHGVLPINGSARSSLLMQPPQFKFSQPRPRRCATHQFLALNIHSHQELMKKSISSGPVASCGTKPLNLKYSLPPTQNFISGNPVVGDFQGGFNLATVSVESVKDRNCDAAMASNAKVTINEKSVLQQASHPPLASNFLHGPGFIFPFGQYQTTMLAANSSGCPQSVLPVGNASLPSNRLSVNLPLPNASSAVSFNHPLLTSNEAYMEMLQNNGCPIPISTNISMPSFKGGSPSMPFFNPSLYSSPVFNVSRNQQQLTTPHASVQSVPQTTNSSSHKQPQCQKQSSDNKIPTLVATNSEQLVPNSFVSHIVNPNNSQPMNFTMMPPISMGGGGTVVIKNTDPSQHGSKSRGELIPQSLASSFGSNASTSSAPMFHILPDMSWNSNQMKNFHAPEGKSLSNSGQSFKLSKTDCKEMSVLSAMGPPKFDSLARSINFLPSSLTGNQNHQQQFIQGQNAQMHQLQLAGSTVPAKHSTTNGNPGPFLTSIFPSNNNPVLSHVSIANDNTSSSPRLKSSTQEQTHMIFGNNNQISAASYSNPSMPRNMGISQRNPSTVGTGYSTVSALPSQEAEAPPAGTGQQKSSSPACRSIVPPILSTCPSQLPELKY